MVSRARLHFGATLVGTLIAALTAAAALLCCVAAANSQQQAQKEAAKALVSERASINLNAILEHQAALEEECAKYHESEVRVKQRRLNALRRAGKEAHFHLQAPLRLEVPAVCLFLFGQFARSSSWPELSTTKRLEMVNWIYEDEETAHNVSKRQAQPQFEADEFLKDYLFDPKVAETNEIDDGPQMSNFHKQVEQLMASDSWRDLAANHSNQLAGHLSPVVLVPGLLGSRLQARTSKMRRVNVFCSKQSEWHDMWLSLRQLLPLAVDCWLDNVRLEYDAHTGWTRQPLGVEARVPDFGSVESVRVMDVRMPKLTQYYAPIIEHYAKLGFTPDQNLLAAPYDFRLAPQQLTGYFERLKHLIERAQANASPRRVTLVCHSMGCTHLLVFLRLQTSAWRQAHVRKMIALSSPWGGAVSALQALVVGENLGLVASALTVTPSKLRALVRNYPSIAYLLPQAEVFALSNKNNLEPGAGGPVLVETPQRAYTAAQLDELLRDISLTQQLEWFKTTTALIKPLEPLPDLQVDCIHSLNVPTPLAIVFRNQTDFPDGAYELVKGDGDGTVNLESLLVCANWASQLPDKVRHKVIMNTDHSGVLSHKVTLDHITEDVFIH